MKKNINDLIEVGGIELLVKVLAGKTYYKNWGSDDIFFGEVFTEDNGFTDIQIFDSEEHYDDGAGQPNAWVRGFPLDSETIKDSDETEHKRLFFGSFESTPRRATGVADALYSLGYETEVKKDYAGGDIEIYNVFIIGEKGNWITLKEDE